MLARDGTELASCDLKKLQWYVSKGLAEWVGSNDDGSTQPTIRLNFEHKQDEQLQLAGSFYLEAKQNRCVGCGTTDHYLKYRCVRICASLLAECYIAANFCNRTCSVVWLVRLETA
jgi:hypothetical protein